MCVKIFTSNEELSYDMDAPLEPQLKDATQVVINYEPEDPAIGKFFKEIERCSVEGIQIDVNLKVMHNDHIEGARAQKKATRLSEALDVNSLIKMLTLSYANADKKLEDIDNCLCCEKDDSVR